MRQSFCDQFGTYNQRARTVARVAMVPRAKANLNESSGGAVAACTGLLLVAENFGPANAQRTLQCAC
jgi:hypothetical protein